MARPNKGFKKANKNATKGKCKGWKKGQSSSFNPTCNEHRLDAKKRAVFGNQGQGNLTIEKLAQHNRIINSKETEESNDELMSLGGDTAITAFTNCSIPTFTRLIKNWNAGSSLHKEMLAVLAAVTDVLQTNGGKETETEYYAALMTTLDVVDTDESLTAVICLLAVVIKRLNSSVLKLHVKTACEKFTKLLIKYMNTENSALLKNLLTIIYTFLKVKTVWTESTSDEFSVLIEYTTHHKPKVRKAAQQIVRTLLVYHSPELSSHHPGAVATAKFCIQKLENSGGSSTQHITLYILAFLKGVISVFPKASVKLTCETIFRVMTLSNPMVTSSCLKVFQGLFISKPKPESLPVDLNARIIMALYDYQPNVNDSRSLSEWLESLNVAFTNLYSLDANLCLSHLPKFYQVATKCWQTDKEDVWPIVSSVLENLLQICICPSSNEFQQALLEDPVNNYMHRMFHSVEEGLSYQYHKAWKHVLSVLATFFEVMGKHCYTVMTKCLQSLADMHDSYRFPYVAELEKAIGVAVHHMGPRIVLNAIPLKINGNSDKPDFKRSWLLPLLRDYIKQTELRFFVQYFLPLAGKIRNKVLVLEQEGKVVESKLYDVLCSQIWSLLPGFCTEPTDLKQCFKDVARTLGIILRDEPTLRMPILSSLRLLISKNLDNEENKLEIARFAKNYLPILFNLYTTETKNKVDERVRLAVYETCKVYLQVTEKELVENFFSKALERMQTQTMEPFMQHALIDLNKAMLPYVNEELILSFYEYCKPLLNHTNQKTQKKCYGVIRVLCNSESESCKSFLKSHLEDMRSSLSGFVSGLTPSSKALRLQCLHHIVHELTESDKECVVAIVPEAVLCTKEVTLRARSAAYNLLVEIGNTFRRWRGDDVKGGLREYILLLLAGLAGSPHMMSASILAIGRIMYEFKGELDSDIIHILIENVCLLLTSRSREVVLSSLSFVKILFSTIDTLDLAQHVEHMVQSITNISEDNQRHFRFKAKELFTRLIRKFGYEMIAKMVPDEYQKQLSYIRKMEARKKRGKKIDNDNYSDSELFETKQKSDNMEDILEDSDEELMLDEDMNLNESRKVGKKRRKLNRDPCIEERGEDDIVDFMDPSISRKLLASKPVKAIMKEKSVDSFPMSEDGRLIIKEEEETKPKSKKNDSTDEKSEVLKELGAITKNTKKRKLEDSDDEDIPEFKGVQKGIHRTIKKPITKNAHSGVEFKAKKAGGDIKKGKLDPYAYLPLNRNALNKRKQVKLKGQFKNIVRAAKRGAVVGTKRKSRQANKKRKT